jgi:serine/threonine protein kinase
VKFLHDNMIAHRDLKIENVLLTSTEDPHIKLTDFGFATRLVPIHPQSPTTSTTPPTESSTASTFPEVQPLAARCGSEEYAAPEVVLAQPYDARKTDIWALGVILFAMIYGELPFVVEPGQRSRVMYHKIARLEYKFPDVPLAVSASGKEAHSGFEIAKSAEDAGGASKADSDTSVESGLSEEENLGRDLIKSIFLGPQSRISMEGILSHPFLKDVEM